MSRTFQTDESTNLHPSFFEFKNQLEPTQRTIEEVESGKLVWSTEDQQYSNHTMFSPPDNTKKRNYASKALEGIQETSEFSFLFFSGDNIDEIQKLIRYNVYTLSNKQYVIDNQDETELVIVMRSIYLQYSRVPLNCKDYSEAIQKLNTNVVNTVTPKLLSNVEQYIGYIKDISKPYEPLARGTNDSIKGQQQPRSITDVLIGDDIFFA